jgi:anti-sigma-K factor RskA
MGPNADIVSLDPKHRSEDVVDYHFGDLSPEARAEFEKHLASCLGCQKAVRTANILFPAVAQALAVPKRRRTTDELVSMMMEEQERLDSEDRAGRSQRRKRAFRRTALWAGPIAAAAAAATLAAGPRVAELVAKLTHPEKASLAAPPAPKAKR